MKQSSKPKAAGKYDFSAIYLVQQDMRKAFRNLAVSQTRFLKQLEKNHNKFFQTILQSRRQLYFGKALEEGTDDLDLPNSKKLLEANSNTNSTKRSHSVAHNNKDMAVPMFEDYSGKLEKRITLSEDGDD